MANHTQQENRKILFVVHCSLRAGLIAHANLQLETTMETTAPFLTTYPSTCGTQLPESEHHVLPFGARPRGLL